jgi:hypothetical protein
MKVGESEATKLSAEPLDRAMGNLVSWYLNEVADRFKTKSSLVILELNRFVIE